MNIQIQDFHRNIFVPVPPPGAAITLIATAEHNRRYSGVVNADGVTAEVKHRGKRIPCADLRSNYWRIYAEISAAEVAAMDRKMQDKADRAMTRALTAADRANNAANHALTQCREARSRLGSAIKLAEITGKDGDVIARLQRALNCAVEAERRALPLQRECIRVQSRALSAESVYPEGEANKAQAAR